MDKKTLRKICKEKRSLLSPEQRASFSYLICEKLKPFLTNKTILSYSPYQEEVDVEFINGSYDVALPVISENRIMKAYRSIDKTYLLNKLGIKEPDPLNSIIVDKSDIDVVIVPLLGFDHDLYRLGHGGGYYDLYLKDMDALKIGVAFSIQKLEELPREAWDIPMDIIITETGILSRKK